MWSKWLAMEEKGRDERGGQRIKAGGKSTKWKKKKKKPRKRQREERDQLWRIGEDEWKYGLKRTTCNSVKAAET